MRPRLGTLFRIAFTLGLTIWVVWRADPRAVGAALSRTSWPWVAAALALVVVDRILMAYRWIALLGPVSGPRPPFHTVLRIFLVSTFVGTFLPGSVGGDAARAWSLSREGVAMSQSLASVLMDRLLGVVSILISVVTGLAIAPDLFRDPWVAWSCGAAALASALSLGFVFSLSMDDLLRRSLARLPGARIRATLGALLDALQAYRTTHGMLVWVLVASVGVQALRIAQAWLLGRGLGLDAPFIAYVVCIPVIVLVMQVPVSISGLGVSQAAFPLAFARFSTPAADAVALSVLFVALGIVGSLPGGLYYVVGPTRAGSAGGPRGV